MKKPLSEREKEAERAKARTFWDGLSNADRGVLGDDLVLGTLDHLDWFGCYVPSAFLIELDRQRLLWEC